MQNFKTINYGGRLIDLSSPCVMGIMNITPDSFYGNSRVIDSKIAETAGKMVEDGAKIIDIGGYSSRPGAKHISEEEELKRILPAARTVHKLYPNVLMSIDTFRSEIVSKLYDKIGAFIVNDISSGEADKQMHQTVANLKLPYIAMHMRGNPANMQNYCNYNDVAADILIYFSEKISQLRDAGVNDIIIDPGFGFSKTTEGNFELLAKLDYFKILELPLLVGLSRKSMFYKLMNINPEDVLPATVAANTIALQKGADILRVHDVKEAVQAITVVAEINIHTQWDS